MKYLKKFEKRKSDDIQKVDKKLIDAVIENNLDDVKKYLSMGANPNKKEDHYTAPMWCIMDFGKIPDYAEPEEKKHWMENKKSILIELINSKPDLYVKSEGMTFWDLLNQDAIDFMKNFPEELEEYNFRSNIRKYNL